MFGQNDKNDNTQQPIGTKPVNPGLLGIDDDNDSNVASVPPLPDSNTPNLPVTPAPGAASTPQISTNPVPTTPTFSADPPTTTSQSSDSVNSSSTITSNDELVSIKRQALQELSPLIDHLEQNAEEKFKTTMMMIQASDNQDLIPQAFKTAKEIPDEKRRAQALLDLVNEINYFTHKTDS